jgi:hypothetical protein
VATEAYPGLRATGAHLTARKRPLNFTLWEKGSTIETIGDVTAGRDGCADIKDNAICGTRGEKAGAFQVRGGFWMFGSTGVFAAHCENRVDGLLIG